MNSDSSKKRVLIAGAGALGSVFGCLLKEAGHEVTLLGRGWHLDAIREHGLRMDGIWGPHAAGGFGLATAAAELESKYDLILITVKAYQTAQMVEAVERNLADHGIAIAAQNGLGNVEILAERFGAARTLGASVLVGATLPAPGRVTVTVEAAPVVIGPFGSKASEAMEKSRHWAALFSRARIPCETTDQILSHVWAKVFYNASLNPLGALLRVHYGALGESEDVKIIMNGIIAEAFAVAQAKKVRLLWDSAADYTTLFYGKLLPATYDHRSSMLQDLERGRRTEIDALNGKIWRYGAELDVATPYNETITRLIKGRETIGKEAT